MYLDVMTAVSENEKGDICRSIHMMNEKHSFGPVVTAIFENTAMWFKNQKVI